MILLKVLNADIVDLWNRGETVCITVSLEVDYDKIIGFVDRGNALAMSRVVPDLPSLLGHATLQHRGEIGFVSQRLIAFYTKPAIDRFERCLPDEVWRYHWGQKIPGAHCVADPTIVARSARQLIRLIDRDRMRRVYLPVPAVGDGALQVDDIKEALDILIKEPRVILVSNQAIAGDDIEMVETL